jgi:hypothetical protein
VLAHQQRNLPQDIPAPDHCCRCPRGLRAARDVDRDLHVCRGGAADAANEAPCCGIDLGKGAAIGRGGVPGAELVGNYGRDGQQVQRSCRAGIGNDHLQNCRPGNKSVTL